MAEKSGRKSGIFKPGKDPRRGKGPAKGAPNAGRPPDAFKELCRELATGEKTIAQLRLILKNKKDPQFMAALRWASEHGYGKPAQPLEHSGGITIEDLAHASRQDETPNRIAALEGISKLGNGSRNGR